MGEEPCAVEELIGTWRKRRAYIPDYQQRQRAGLWIASTRVEKYNDWAVSGRCKHQGMSWSPQGVLALAAWKPHFATVNSMLGVGTVSFRSESYRNRFGRLLDRGTGAPEVQALTGKATNSAKVAVAANMSHGDALYGLQRWDEALDCYP